MAEFCLECWNKINGTNDSAGKYILSDDLELCEECGNYRRVIIVARSAYYMYKFRYILFPFVMTGRLLYILWCILLLPNLLIRDHHKNS